MSTRLWTCCVVGALVVACAVCGGSPGFIMKQEVTEFTANCYLVYDSQSREAVLIDAGGPIDSLLAHIADQRLDVRYFLVTHGHPDHVAGLPDLRRRFPEAQVCMHKAAFDDLQLVQRWLIDEVGTITASDVAANPEMEALAKLLEFEVASFEKPDMFIRDSETLELGSLSITAIHSPGHSPGSVCYRAGDMLFSGDVLFHRAVGRVDLPNSSAEDLISSVRRLYSDLPESTKVYPGHGEPTDIGSEKRDNPEITLAKADP